MVSDSKVINSNFVSVDHSLIILIKYSTIGSLVKGEFEPIREGECSNIN
jgi:hypothetical protein